MNKSFRSFRFKLPALSFLLTVTLLAFVHIKIDPPLLLLERFLPGYGWIEIVFVGFYASLITNRMERPDRVEKWRKISWLVFSFVFFSQLLLGILFDDRFLMTGKLHLPVPAMIVAGPIYRLKISFMTMLFLSTILLTGPAWCSHLCYFGAFDNCMASGNRLRNRPVKNKIIIKHVLFFLFISVVIVFRISGISSLIATLAGIAFGVAGLVIMFIFSFRKNKMIHCILYCPVGSIVHILKYINPFRITIEKACTTCMACTLKCKYDALNFKDIRNHKPGLTCTYCGECIEACHQHAIQYRFLNLNSKNARNLYLILSISLHAVFLALGRI